ncbi:hypothetical protein C7S20_13105 [Christiangramia fulva]|uniref:histidine kinase n=1 Tax=Christiangramia fulva TaxID=2126553 RepID=A0A2R3Z7B8_9FLAO|nr:PAS domain S-box protein [Christiangramia fulva]AVR46118.1 hypothetical protein C7S20_13105 [Christiangramia fulva]
MLKNTPQNAFYQLISEDISAFYFLQENAKDGMFIYDPDAPDNLQIDPKLSKTLGLDFNELTRIRNWQNLLTKEGLDKLNSLIDSKNQEINKMEFPLRFKRTDGTAISMICRFKTISGEVGNLKLIAALKKVNNNEVDSNPELVRYRHIIEGTNIGLWEWNIQTGEMIFHEQWAKVLGYCLADLMPTTTETWKVLTHPEDNLKRKKLLQEHFAGAKPFYECELRMKHKNGQWIWVEDKGKVVSWTDDGQPEWMTGFHEEITETKQRLHLKKTFIDNAPSSIAMFNKNMNYIATSLQWVKNYGLEKLDVIGKNHYEIFPDLDQKWKDIFQKSLNGEILKKEADLLTLKDGSKIWINWEVRPWYTREEEIAGIIVRTANISHIKKLEQVAEEKQIFLETILESIDVGIISCDAEAKLTIFNNTLRDWYGIPERDIPQSEYSKYYGLYKEDGITPLKTEEIPLIKALQNKTVKNEVVVIKPRNSSDKIVSVTGSQLKDDSGNIKGAVVAIHDITERKKVEEKLIETIAKMEAVLNATTSTMLIGTDVNGIITFFNKGAEKLLGYKKEEVVNIMKPEVFHHKEELLELGRNLSPNSKPLKGFEIFKELVQREQSVREWNMIKKDDTRFPVHLVITSIKEKGGIVGYLGVGIDISEFKKAEKELKSIVKITKNQNERLKNFAHIVSHNLRSHSGNIEMLLQLYLEENPDAAKDSMMIHLNKASDNLNETIAHLNEVVVMNTSIKESLTELKLSQYVNHAIENNKILAEKNSIKIENKVPKNLKILGIPAYLDSILLNLISNSIKYSSPKRAGFIQIRATRLPDFVLLEIEDNGLGIDLKKYRRKLFGMYKTFHSKKDARGIGLFITKNQIEAMGGKIDVESKLNKGTTFKIYFRNEKN